MGIKTIMKQALPVSDRLAEAYAPYAEAACLEFDIKSPLRIANFLAHTCYESMNYKRFVESGHYSADRLQQVFEKYYRSRELAEHHAYKPQLIFSRTYANRFGNGNEASGDGYKYRGRSPIGLTFRDNYEACGEALGLDLVNHPELIEDPKHGFRAAAWFFKENGLNEISDTGDINTLLDQLEATGIIRPPSGFVRRSTRRIQGGHRGYRARLKLVQRIIKLYHKELKANGELKKPHKSRRLKGLVTIGAAASTQTEPVATWTGDVLDGVNLGNEPVDEHTIEPTEILESLETSSYLFDSIHGIISRIDFSDIAFWVLVAIGAAYIGYSWWDDRRWGYT